MFETFFDKAVTNLIYRYRLVVRDDCKFNLQIFIWKKNVHRKWFWKRQIKVTVTVSMSPDTVMLWQGVILEISQK